MSRGTKLCMPAILVCCCLLLRITGTAQLRFGITGGSAASTASIIPAIRYGAGGLADFKTIRKAIITYHGGLSIAYPVSRSLNLKGDILWSQKGWILDYKFLRPTSISSHEFSTVIKEKFLLTYLELPVMLVYSVPAGAGKGYVGGGGYFAYMLNAKQEDLTNDGRFPFLEEGAVIDTNHNKHDYGFTIAMGYEYGFGLFFNIMVTYGLQEIYKKDKEDQWAARNYQTQNRQLRLSVGYMFNRKKTK